MNEGMGAQETSGISLGKGSPQNKVQVDGRATVELYSGERLFSADNGKTLTFGDIIKRTASEIAELFKSIGQDVQQKAENIEAGFVEYCGVWIRPANLIDIRNQSNLITTNGRVTVAAAMADESITVAPKNPVGVQVGLGSTAAALGDTGVQTRCTDTTNDFSAFDTNTYPSRSSAIVTWKSDFGTAACQNEALTEAVLCSAAHAGNGASQGTNGDAVSRITFTAINKGTNDTLAVQFQWTFTSS